jgi:hypothetical protein
MSSTPTPCLPCRRGDHDDCTEPCGCLTPSHMTPKRIAEEQAEA